jgi:hypothetical protein
MCKHLKYYTRGCPQASPLTWRTNQARASEITCYSSFHGNINFLTVGNTVEEVVFVTPSVYQGPSGVF